MARLLSSLPTIAVTIPLWEGERPRFRCGDIPSVDGDVTFPVPSLEVH